GELLIKDVPVEPDKETVLFQRCHLTVLDDQIVAECDSIEAGEKLAKLLMKDVFIRLKPVSVTKE
ncbi:unnamed protein product, partial [marine sediment metagenome]